MQNASQALAGALPTGGAANPSLLVTLQDSLKFASMPSFAATYFDALKAPTAGAEQGWFSKPVLGSLLALVATLLVVEQVSSMTIARVAFVLISRVLPLFRSSIEVKRPTCQEQDGPFPSLVNSQTR